MQWSEKKVKIIPDTGKNNRFPFFGYFRVFKEYPQKSQIWKSWLGIPWLGPGAPVGTCLTLPNLGFLWVFFKCPKISNNGNLLFFPVGDTRVWEVKFERLTFFPCIPQGLQGNSGNYCFIWIAVHVLRNDVTGNKFRLILSNQSSSPATLPRSPRR